MASCGPKAPGQASVAPPADPPPAFAYPMNVQAVPASARPPVDKSAPVAVPGGKFTLAYGHVHDLYDIPDWRPEEHPKLPPIVRFGRKPDVGACGYCHLPSGAGRTENARLAGLPAAYIIAQMQAYRDGLRTSAVPGRAPSTAMEKLGKLATDAEIKQAAAYFSSVKPRSFVRVVETDTIPAVEEVSWIYKKVEGAAPVPLGRRIIETPDDFELFEKRDPDAIFIAYVPKGSIAQGKTLAENWGEERVFACAACHGEGLHGKDDVPSLAGKSPTYVVRQLNNFKTGARKGAQSALMSPVVQNMRTDDMIELAAYLGSLTP
jgi:cytochrome c553